MKRWHTILVEKSKGKIPIEISKHKWILLKRTFQKSFSRRGKNSSGSGQKYLPVTLEAGNFLPN